MWFRARFIRTKRFMKATKPNSRFGKRPPQAIALFPWRQRLVVAMDRGLPYLLRPDTLVTRGQTQLKDILGSDELAQQRGQCISCPSVEVNGVTWLLTTFKRTSNDISAFVISVDGETVQRRAKLNVRGFTTRELTVANDTPIVLAWKRARWGDGIDVSYGTRVSVLGDQPFEARVPGLLLFDVSATVSDGSVVLRALAVEDDIVDDVRHGRTASSARLVDITLSKDSVHVEDVELAAKPLQRARCRAGFADAYIARNDGYMFISGQQRYEMEQGEMLSGCVMHESGTYFSAVVTGRQAAVLIFERDSQAVVRIPLEGLGASEGGIWTDQQFEWSEEGSKVVKSSWELFDAKDWNDIDSGFSSLGLRL